MLALFAGYDHLMELYVTEARLKRWLLSKNPLTFVKNYLNPKLPDPVRSTSEFTEASFDEQGFGIYATIRTRDVKRIAAPRSFLQDIILQMKMYKRKAAELNTGFGIPRNTVFSQRLIRDVVSEWSICIPFPRMEGMRIRLGTFDIRPEEMTIVAADAEGAGRPMRLASVSNSGLQDYFEFEKRNLAAEGWKGMHVLFGGKKSPKGKRYRW